MRPAPAPGRAASSDIRLAHLGLLVHGIAGAAELYRRLGLAAGEAETFTPEAVRVAFVPAGASSIELLEPLEGRGPLARFLARRGEGVHHVAIEVPDLRAALERARAAGAVLLDALPRRGMHGSEVAFLHPESAHGVLIELVEAPRDAQTSHDPPG